MPQPGDGEGSGEDGGQEEPAAEHHHEKPGASQTCPAPLGPTEQCEDDDGNRCDLADRRGADHETAVEPDRHEQQEVRDPAGVFQTLRQAAQGVCETLPRLREWG